jgi:hypothetical protein
MHDLNSFIQEEKQKAQQHTQNSQEQPKQNVKMSLLDLKRAVDSGTTLNNNPLVETIKKIDNIVEPVVGGTVTEQRTNKNTNNFEEKEDEFTKQLLLKTREFMSGKQSTPQPVSENYNIQEIEPNHVHPKSFNKMSTEVPNKQNVIDVLKDTMLELYVKEKVEGIIKEYITSDEGKKMIKSIVVNLFKKK